MPARKRRQSVAELDKEANNSIEMRQETLARKLKKMLSNSTKQSSKVRAEFGQKITGNDMSRCVNAATMLRGQPLCQMQTLHHMLHNSLSLVHYLHDTSLGLPSVLNKQSVKRPLVREFENLALLRIASPFNRRVTALEWHPTQYGLVLACSKGGDIMLWNSQRQNMNDPFTTGSGPGGSIQAVKFWPWNSNSIVTASIDGEVRLTDLETWNSSRLTCTWNCHESWYCCVDVNASRKTVVTGDNSGNTIMMTQDGISVWSHRLHKNKVTHTEFSPKEDWLLCTASTDNTVKVWDIRKVSGRGSALHVLHHDKPVNSAYFSRTDGCRLLTTDQHSQIRVYESPGWHLVQSIPHPHRFFRHLTPIKATWHPLQDMIVVGRYPCQDFPGYVPSELRTIDIIDVDSGKIVSQLHDPSASGIVSLSKFNDRGDLLASGMGVNLLLWAQSHEVHSRQQLMMATSDFSPTEPNHGRSTGHSMTRNSSNPKTSSNSRNSSLSASDKSKKNSDAKLKMKLQANSKTKKSK